MRQESLTFEARKGGLSGSRLSLETKTYATTLGIHELTLALKFPENHGLVQWKWLATRNVLLKTSLLSTICGFSAAPKH